MRGGFLCTIALSVGLITVAVAHAHALDGRLDNVEIPIRVKDSNVCQEGSIIIIGAGVSGLLAARSLKEFGCNVTILEALNRTGGRTHTFGSGTFQGVEEGAHWVHGGVDNLPSSQLLSFLGIKQIRVGGDSNWEGSRDLLKLFLPKSRQPLSPAERDASFDLFQTASALLDSFVDDNYEASQVHNVSIAEVWRKALSGINYTYTNQLLMRWHQRIVFEQDEGAPISKCNAGSEFVDDYTDFYRGGMNAGWEKHGDAFVEGGYSAIVDALGRGLEVHLNTPVNDIVHSAKEVTVRSGEKVFKGAAVLITASIGVLQSGTLVFQPALPHWKAAALARLGMGNVAKIFIKLNGKANQDLLGSYSTGWLTVNDALLTYCSRHGWEQTGSDVLECFLGGDAALAAERMDASELRKQVELELSSILGGNTSLVEHVAITQWSANPYIRGAWSYAPLGASDKDFEALAAPADRLYFAGEGTCRMLYGNVHAAIVSGARAAYAILGLGNASSADVQATSQKWPFFSSELIHLCTQAPKAAWHRTAPKACLRLGLHKRASADQLYV